MQMSTLCICVSVARQLCWHRCKYKATKRSLDICISVDTNVDAERRYSASMLASTMMQRRASPLCIYVGVDVDVERSFRYSASTLASTQLSSDANIDVEHRHLCHSFPSLLLSHILLQLSLLIHNRHVRSLMMSTFITTKHIIRMLKLSSSPSFSNFHQ